MCNLQNHFFFVLRCIITGQLSEVWLENRKSNQVELDSFDQNVDFLREKIAFIELGQSDSESCYDFLCENIRTRKTSKRFRV